MNSLMTFVYAFAKGKKLLFTNTILAAAACFMLALPVASFAGDGNDDDPGKRVAYRSAEWVHLETTDGVEIFYKYADCNDRVNGMNFEYLQFKFVNNTTKQKHLKWNYELYYDNRCVSCGDAEEHTVSLNLAPDQVYASDCENYNTDKIGVFSRALDAKAERLTKFKLANLTVNSK